MQSVKIFETELLPLLHACSAMLRLVSVVQMVAITAVQACTGWVLRAPHNQPLQYALLIPPKAEGLATLDRAPQSGRASMVFKRICSSFPRS
jgi:hypothetical protein